MLILDYWDWGTVGIGYCTDIRRKKGLFRETYKKEINISKILSKGHRKIREYRNK